jgi:hypothetical protein
MVTGGYGDITFEPPASKILNLTNSIAVLTAGDQSLQLQVFQMASIEIGKLIAAEPAKWIDISRAANIYSKCFYKLRKKLIENQVLLPLGLNYDTFITQQKVMDKDFINLVISKINRFINDLESIATIITGIDDTGPHIYVVENGEVSCHDKLGFASIGIGSYHANSHFMFAKYSREEKESKALLTIHQAKKKSEVSPGVGKDTDMCLIGPQKGTFTLITKPPFPTDIVKDLDDFYKKYKEKIEKMDKQTEKDIADYINKQVASPKPQEMSPSPSVSPSASPSPSESPSPSPSPAPPPEPKQKRRIKK